jgi:hypothetical protein
MDELYLTAVDYHMGNSTGLLHDQLEKTPYEDFSEGSLEELFPPLTTNDRASTLLSVEFAKREN